MQHGRGNRHEPQHCLCRYRRSSDKYGLCCCSWSNDNNNNRDSDDNGCRDRRCDDIHDHCNGHDVNSDVNGRAVLTGELSHVKDDLEP